MANRTWFITGVSSGIGRHLAEQLLERGDRVAGTSRDAAKLGDLAEKHGERFRPYSLDVTDPAAVERVVGGAFDALGRIDVIVSNAGFGLFGAVEEVGDGQVMRVIETNLLGSIRVLRAALPRLRQQGGGRIIQVSSAGGQTTYPGFAAYHASKWGIEGFCETLAKEVAPFNIGVTVAEPGATRTQFGENLPDVKAMPEYDATSVGDVRRGFTNGDFPIDGDAAKVARAIIDSADVDPAPPRLTLGRDTYRDVAKSLADRLAVVESQREMAMSTLADDAAAE